MAVNSFREDEEQKETVNRVTLVRLYKYMFAYKKEVIGVLFIMAVCIAITLVNPLIIERAIEVYIKNSDKPGLIRLGIFGIAINIVLVLLIKLRMWIMAKVCNNILKSIREELYVHIQKLSFNFFDSRPTGKILARIMGDVNSLKDILSDSVTTLIPEFLTVIAVAAIMIVKNVYLALSVLVVMPFLTVCIVIVQKAAHKRWQLVRKKSSNLNAYIHEELSGIRIIQSFTAKDEAMDNFDGLLKEHKDSFVNAVLIADGFSALIEISWGVGTFLLYYIGVKVLGVGTVGVGTLLAFGTYSTMFWSPIRNLANFYNKIVTNISAAERIFEILDTEPEISDSKDAYGLPEIKGAVEFDDVTFSYSDKADSNVLQNVSFSVKPGENIALVGPTGAGKTTIVSLISRFYEVSSGRILIDGNDISKVSIEGLRSQMGVMTQDNFLFSGTIKDNIRYGKLDATDEEIINAAKAVHAHDFIMKLEKGYDTEISERGSRLSNGQRQLLAFARTMVSNPGILILDEATSSIDTHTEILVQKGIEAMLKGRTSFVIAHRLSTIKNADRIFVIDKGGIIESGSHDELMAKKGAYYELYAAQFKAVND
ncbi:ABC transporter ATP-binding protein/permease [Falcatimonas sp. MSJ-15]|uniref:ABC transporter ATP-binding protein n=1 Tax=Falcatimonas sp. MSJ-15 TaxID=2841515 RepID=UPI001C11B924|nr:ABC transporter ATP-binding protein/permease [Falcatimonas sp. MSJ-15]